MLGIAPESPASGERFVGQVLQDDFDFNILTVCIGVLVGNLATNQRMAEKKPLLRVRSFTNNTISIKSLQKPT